MDGVVVGLAVTGVAGVKASSAVAGDACITMGDLRSTPNAHLVLFVGWVNTLWAAGRTQNMTYALAVPPEVPSSADCILD